MGLLPPYDPAASRRAFEIRRFYESLPMIPFARRESAKFAEDSPEEAALGPDYLASIRIVEDLRAAVENESRTMNADLRSFVETPARTEWNQYAADRDATRLSAGMFARLVWHRDRNAMASLLEELKRVHFGMATGDLSEFVRFGSLNVEDPLVDPPRGSFPLRRTWDHFNPEAMDCYWQLVNQRLANRLRHDLIARTVGFDAVRAFVEEQLAVDRKTSIVCDYLREEWPVISARFLTPSSDWI